MCSQYHSLIRLRNPMKTFLIVFALASSTFGQWSWAVTTPTKAPHDCDCVVCKCATCQCSKPMMLIPSGNCPGGQCSPPIASKTIAVKSNTAPSCANGTCNQSPASTPTAGSKRLAVPTVGAGACSSCSRGPVRSVIAAQPVRSILSRRPVRGLFGRIWGR